MTKTANFERFHADNPHVYQLMVQASRTLWATGKRLTGVDMMLGEVRWDETTFTTGSTHNGTEYKISNDHKPFYSRLIMYENPDVRGLFKLREAEADAWIAAYITQREGRSWTDWADDPEDDPPPSSPLPPPPAAPGVQRTQDGHIDIEAVRRRLEDQ